MNAPAQPVPAPNGYPSMNVVRALARASKRVAEVTCLGKSGDPRDPYAYARADDVVSAAKEAIQAEGLLVLPASSDQKAEPVDTRESVIWLRQTFNVIHEPTGEWLPFQADPWPLQKNKPLDKAMATAKTASKAYFYLSLLEIRRVGPNAEDMDADFPPVSEQTPKCSDKPAERSDKTPTDSTQMGVSSRGKQSPSGKRASMVAAEKSSPREVVDPEALKRELDEAAREAFGGDDPDPTMPPTPASALLQSIPGLKTGSDLVARLGEALEVTAAQQHEAGASHSVSSAGGEVPPLPLSSPPALGPSESLTEEDWGSTPQRGRPVSAKSPSETPKRKARSVNWAKATTRKARQAFWCAECQSDSAATYPGEAIKKGDQHRDSGNGPRLCLACWERMETEAKKAGKEVA